MLLTPPEEQQAQYREIRYVEDVKGKAVQFCLQKEVAMVPDFTQITSVAVIPFVDNGEIMVTRLKRGVDIPGGHVEPADADIAATASREAAEEAAIELARPLYVVGVISSDYKGPGPDDVTYMLITTCRVSKINEFTAEFAGQRDILDLGCGEGALSQFVPQSDAYTGVDISAEAIEKANQLYPSRKFMTADLASLAVTDFRATERYDAIVLNEVLYYLSEEEMATALNFLISATRRWDDPLIVASICRTDLQTLNHGSYYWSRLFKTFKHHGSIEVADQKHRWDIKLFQGARAPADNRQV
jgi:8-oxo-dGTP pyrophosphatase MutT (NUDIX family)